MKLPSPRPDVASGSTSGISLRSGVPSATSLRSHFELPIIVSLPLLPRMTPRPHPAREHGMVGGAYDCEWPRFYIPLLMRPPRFLRRAWRVQAGGRRRGRARLLNGRLALVEQWSTQAGVPPADRRVSEFSDEAVSFGLMFSWLSCFSGALLHGVHSLVQMESSPGPKSGPTASHSVSGRSLADHHSYGDVLSLGCSSFFKLYACVGRWRCEGYHVCAAHGER